MPLSVKTGHCALPSKINRTDIAGQLIKDDVISLSEDESRGA